jgi:LytS/YehU family sensor histidine kinase
MLMRKFLEHSKSNMVTLQEEAELLRLYVELEAMRSKNKFSFQLKIAPDVDIFNIEIPSMLFQPFIENAITHGIFNLDRHGHLVVSFHIDDSCLIGIIEDDGVGRKKASELNVNSHKNHASRGMEIVKERIRVLNYMENSRIEMSVIDKTSSSGEPEGTRIIIKIPI